MAAAIINLVILIPFLLFAFALSKGKGAFLIAGYNTLPDHERAQYDETAVCKFMGRIMYGVCFSILLWSLSDLLAMRFLFAIGMVLFIFLITFSLIYVNTGNRFKND